MVNQKSIQNKTSLYAIHPSVKHLQAIVANLPAKTGLSLEEWGHVVKQKGPDGLKEQKAWLKKEYQVGGTTAMIISEYVNRNYKEFDETAYLLSAVQYVETLYSGQKEALRPIHDALISISLDLGDDIMISPCKTIVPIYREHVIAEIKPSTKTRVDLGLALKLWENDYPVRLIDTGGLQKGDRITHRIALSNVEEIDEEVIKWLAIAYELDDNR